MLHRLQEHTAPSEKQQGEHGYSKLLELAVVEVMSVSGSLPAVKVFDSVLARKASASSKKLDEKLIHSTEIRQHKYYKYDIT